jgi:hypothetical protein
MSCICGVDPGCSGAIAFFFPEHPEVISVRDVPLAGGKIDAAALAAIIEQMKPDVAIVEQVGPMPKQGVSSTFNFGEAYGTLKGVIGARQLPLHLVTPGRWKKHFRLSSDKEQARALAIRMWPSSEHFRLKKSHGRAEAALIARFYAETALHLVEAAE